MIDHYFQTASQHTFPVEPQTRELAFQPPDYRIQVHMVNQKNLIHYSITQGNNNPS